MRSIVLLLMLLTGCGGLAWNTTVADHPQVRGAMLASIVPGATTEARFRAQWGNPTQKMREGGQVAYVYRNMSNPSGYLAPQFGDSTAFVVVLFQYGVAVGGYSSDTQGCRATFAPRPPGAGFDNPSTVRHVRCGVPTGADAGRDKGLTAILKDYAGYLHGVIAGGSGVAGTGGTGAGLPPVAGDTPGVSEDSYVPGSAGKYR